jgi:lysosomal Pro-X carboxypeptidase
LTKTVAYETKALIIFGEHRYFGASLPFSPEVAFWPLNNLYLTVDQAMLDYVDLITYIRKSRSLQDKPCIVFGGSYGGMLAAWLRMKFPHVFQGALASSAPLLYFKRELEFSFSDHCIESYRKVLDKAPGLIREGFEQLDDFKSRPETWPRLSKIYNTCKPIETPLHLENLYYHISEGYQEMAMTNYPYPASFLQPMPACPV